MHKTDQILGDWHGYYDWQGYAGVNSLRGLARPRYLSGWASPTGGWACWTSASEVGCLRQTECATDRQNHRSQELCCFRSRHLEQPTNRPASLVIVDGNFCTTPEGTPVPQHWMTYACSASEFFFKAALFISDFIIMSCPLGQGTLSDDVRLTSLSLSLSVSYIGPKSRTERPRKTKIGTEVAHVTRDSNTTFKVKRPGAYCGSLPLSLLLLLLLSTLPGTKVLSQSTSGFGFFVPIDRSRRALQASDVRFSNFGKLRKLLAF